MPQSLMTGQVLLTSFLGPITRKQGSSLASLVAHLGWEGPPGAGAHALLRPLNGARAGDMASPIWCSSFCAAWPHLSAGSPATRARATPLSGTWPVPVEAAHRMSVMALTPTCASTVGLQSEITPRVCGCTSWRRGAGEGQRRVCPFL